MFGQECRGEGELVFVTNIMPMFKLIGGRDGRLAESLQETCKNEFVENIGGQRGQGTFQRDFFCMMFYEMGDQAGLEEAVKIVNKIG
ncbi:MAG: hypothetical protein ACPGQV_13460 [Alphaproteobacteria bacterium]